MGAVEFGGTRHLACGDQEAVGRQAGDDLPEQPPRSADGGGEDFGEQQRLPRGHAAVLDERGGIIPHARPIYGGPTVREGAGSFRALPYGRASVSTLLLCLLGVDLLVQPLRLNAEAL